MLSYYCDQGEIILKGNCGFHLDFQNSDYSKTFSYKKSEEFAIKKLWGNVKYILTSLCSFGLFVVPALSNLNLDLECIILGKDSMQCVCKYTPSFLCYEMLAYGKSSPPFPKVKWAELSFLCKKLKEGFDLWTQPHTSTLLSGWLNNQGYLPVSYAYLSHFKCCNT